MNTLVQSETFSKWLLGITDTVAKAKIFARLRTATLGNFGDSKPVGDGVFEMRIHVGAGYRVYYVRTGATVYFLLAGGTKSSQQKDIAKAKTIAFLIKETGNE